MSLFQSIHDLPALIRANLPGEAQEVYLAAYNRTWERLAAGESKNLEITAEAHKAARVAVQHEFCQDEKGDWRRDPVGEAMTRLGKLGDAPGKD